MSDEQRLMEALEESYKYYIVGEEDTSLEQYQVVQGDGLYTVNNSPIGKIIMKTSSFPLPGLKTVYKNSLEYSLPKIPKKIYYSLIGLFRKCYKEYKTEIRANVYWDPENRSYLIDVPKQTVGHAVTTETDQDELISMSQKYIHVLETHSHHNMRGNFSSIDDNAQDFLFPISLVIGNIFDEKPSYAMRIRYHKHDLELSLNDVFDMPKAIDYEAYITSDSWKSKLTLQSQMQPLKKEHFLPTKQKSVFDTDIDLSNVRKIEMYQPFMEEDAFFGDMAPMAARIMGVPNV